MSSTPSELPLQDWFKPLDNMIGGLHHQMCRHIILETLSVTKLDRPPMSASISQLATILTLYRTLLEDNLRSFGTIHLESNEYALDLLSRGVQDILRQSQIYYDRCEAALSQHSRESKFIIDGENVAIFDLKPLWNRVTRLIEDAKMFLMVQYRLWREQQSGGKDAELKRKLKLVCHLLIAEQHQHQEQLGQLSYLDFGRFLAHLRTAQEPQHTPMVGTMQNVVLSSTPNDAAGQASELLVQTPVSPHADKDYTPGKRFSVPDTSDDETDTESLWTDPARSASLGAVSTTQAADPVKPTKKKKKKKKKGKGQGKAGGLSEAQKEDQLAAEQDKKQAQSQRANELLKQATKKLGTYKCILDEIAQAKEKVDRAKVHENEGEAK